MIAASTLLGIRCVSPRFSDRWMTACAPSDSIRSTRPTSRLRSFTSEFGFSSSPGLSVRTVTATERCHGSALR